jgi:peptidoglycan/xylan/chitin deacetylase (PgdA/CDA1 family)
MSNKPLLVISLDFELYWGMFDKVTLEQYGENIRGVHTAIPEILTLFKENGIHATWATVGMLMQENKSELEALLPNPELRPKYADMSVSSYAHIQNTSIGEHASGDPYHYGAHLVEKIIETPFQELASHTFSHYYCLDGGENGEAIFAADCDAFARAAFKFNRPITSIVFPRNQANAEALNVCKAQGFTSYRGTPHHFLYTGKKEKEQTSPLLRMLRLLDAYINLSGHHTFTLESAKGSILTNIAGSRFLRPYSKTLRLLEPLRIARIKNSMTHAAKNNQVFHLWWHPHNFGINRKENLAALLELIAHYKKLHDEYGMESATMQEAAIRANGSHA